MCDSSLPVLAMAWSQQTLQNQMPDCWINDGGLCGLSRIGADGHGSARLGSDSPGAWKANFSSKTVIISGQIQVEEIIKPLQMFVSVNDKQKASLTTS